MKTVISLTVDLNVRRYHQIILCENLIFFPSIWLFESDCLCNDDEWMCGLSIRFQLDSVITCPMQNRICFKQFISDDVRHIN